MRRIDAALVGMVLIWGVNYSVIKRAFAEIPPQPFNAIRLVIASSVFLAAILYARRRARRGADGVSSVLFTPTPITRQDRWDLFWLGLIGHFVYQFCFVGGVNQTSVSNAALIIGATPVAVAVISALFGRERITALHWAGAAISIAGLYFVVGHGAEFGGRTFRGDLLVMTSVACWVVYTLGASRLIARHSPLFVTGMTMAIGGVPYVAATLPQLLAMDWGIVRALDLGVAGVVRAAGAERGVSDLVHGRAEDRRGADVDVLEPGADRGDDRGRRVARRAPGRREDPRRGGGAVGRVPDAART